MNTATNTPTVYFFEASTVSSPARRNSTNAWADWGGTADLPENLPVLVADCDGINFRWTGPLTAAAEFETFDAEGDPMVETLYFTLVPAEEPEEE